MAAASADDISVERMFDVKRLGEPMECLYLMGGFVIRAR